MPPNISNEDDLLLVRNKKLNNSQKEDDLPPRDYVLVWKNIMLYIILHTSATYGFYLMLFSGSWYTLLWTLLLYKIGCVGVTAGAHRLWSHKAYKAKTPLKILLVVLQTLAFQDSVIDWARNHRVHHKYSETDADPHSAKRGFFFSHVGWLLCRHHPEVRQKRKLFDFSDLNNDPILAFQKKYYLSLVSLISFLFPTVVPVYFWGESWFNAWYINLFRYALSLNCTWLVNSAAHLFGQKPYDKTIYPVENLGVSIMAVGEGWHNYHHTFPWDYKAAELGKYSTNITTGFIDLMAKIGWAYDLKSVSQEMIKKRVQRTGDGTHELWGWDDKDQPEEEKKEAVITYKNCDE